MRTKLNCFTLLIFLTLILTCYAYRDSAAETTTPQKASQANTEATLKEADTHRATVNVERLNLRRKATIESRILGVLEKGDLLQVTSISGDWLNVVTPTKKTGWVYRIYVDTDFEVKEAEQTSSDEKVKPLQPPAKDNIAVKDLETVDPVPTKESKEAPTQPPSENLRKKLESVWNAYREAHRKGDIALYKNTCSARSCGTLINTLSEVREELRPEDLIFFYDRIPDLATFSIVDMKENGPTVGLLYVDENQEGPDPNLPPPKRFLFIKFVRETWGWAVDGTYSISVPKHRIDNSETQFDYASLPEELAIDGKVLPAPKASKKPKIRVAQGALVISSYGYITSVAINGFAQGKADNTEYSGTVSGSLKKGMNNIEIVIAKSDKQGPNLPPEVTVHHLSTSGEKREVFLYEPENTYEGRYTFTFMVE